MKLYHGTSESVARVAIREGLWPRALTGGESLWERTVPSNSQLVYLTSSYPAYFAANASKEGERWAIIEVDTDLLDEDNLHPDEDAIEQSTRRVERTGFDELDAIPAGNMKERTIWFRDHIILFQGMWKESLAALGTVGYYGVIPPEAITRVSFYDPKSSPGLSLALMDTMVSLLNFQFCQDRNKRMIEVLMGDSKDPAALMIHPALGEMHPEIRQRAEEAISAINIEILSGVAHACL